MQVVCLDENGQVESSKWVWNKRPDRYATNGPSHVRNYVARLATSQSEFASLIVMSPDGNRGFSLMKRKEEPISYGLMFEWRDQPEDEARARAFFDDLKIHPDEDYLAGNGEVSDATRVLEWPIGTSADYAVEICERGMRELCAIKDEEALDITYEE